MFSMFNTIFVAHYYLFIMFNFLFVLLKYLFPVIETNCLVFKIFLKKYCANIGKCDLDLKISL